MTSVNFEIVPIDSLCRYWAKILEAETAIPLPVDVRGASDIPTGFLPKGDVELFEGDAVIEGEEVDCRKQRGWIYTLTVCRGGKLIKLDLTAKAKAVLRGAQADKDILRGAGQVAAAIRSLHAHRMGLNVEAETEE